MQSSNSLYTESSISSKELEPNISSKSPKPSKRYSAVSDEYMREDDLPDHLMKPMSDIAAPMRHLASSEDHAAPMSKAAPGLLVRLAGSNSLSPPKFIFPPVISTSPVTVLPIMFFSILKPVERVSTRASPITYLTRPPTLQLSFIRRL